MMSRSVRSIYRLLVLTLAVLLTIPPAQAQAPIADVTIRHIEATAKENGEVRVSAFVSVLNDQGLPVLDLEANNFTVSENNTAVDSELTVTPATNPSSVLLLIDTSSNMASPDSEGVRAMDRTKDAATAFIDTLPERDQVAIYEYSSGISSSQDFTYDHNLAIDRGVASLDARQSEVACLYDALLHVVGVAAEIQQGQRMVIVLTGNPASTAEEVCAGTTLDDVLGVATTTGSKLPIFMASFGQRDDQDDLSLLARLTGGQSLLAPDSITLTNLMLTISDQLQSQYELSYPTQASSGLLAVVVKENSSQLSDRRQVFIPAAIEPTPTSPAQFSINLNINQTTEDKLEVEIIDLPVGVTLAQTELYINNTLTQKAAAPPFDRFEIDIIELGSGKHTVRVEVTAENGVVAVAESEVTLSIPPTPAPTPVPTQTPDVDTAAPAGDGTINRFTLLLIGSGLVIILFVVAFMMVYFFFFYNKRQPVPAVASSTPRSAIPATGGNVYKAPLPRKARLVVVEGHKFLFQSEFELSKSEITIGRNTDIIVNDIHINSKTVSRSHAKITQRDHNFFIQDLTSSTGTLVNDHKLAAYQEVILQDRAVITIGLDVKFRVMLEARPHTDSDETILEVPFDSDQTILEGFSNADPGQTILEDPRASDPSKTMIAGLTKADPGQTILEDPLNILPDKAVLDELRNVPPEMTVDLDPDEYLFEDDDSEDDINKK
jgi:pSer/pThr/pTyr-binding forkhead associated (FHA) protein